jgi:membrane-associated phospholipid phosphatase
VPLATFVFLASLAGLLLAVSLGAAAALVVVVGISRVYAGEHWASDVLGAWLFGAALLLALTGMWRRSNTGVRGDRTQIGAHP